MSEIQFDHIAIAARRLADAPAVLVGALGGAPTGDGGPAGPYTWGQWGFAGGGRLEILELRGADGYRHRFLAAVAVDAGADEGPLAIEFSSARDPTLGTSFRRSVR